MKVMLPVEAIRHRGFVLHTVQTAILDFGRMSKPAPCSSLFCEHFWQVESYIRHVVGGFLDKCAATGLLITTITTTWWMQLLELPFKHIH